MSTPPRALDLRKIVQHIEQATGIRSGFPTQQDYARFHRVVEFTNLSRDYLGHDPFCAAFRIVTAEAVRVAPLDFLAEPVRDHRHVIVGYEFGFADDETAVAFRDAAMAAMRAKDLV